MTTKFQSAERFFIVVFASNRLKIRFVAIMDRFGVSMRNRLVEVLRGVLWPNCRRSGSRAPRTTFPR